MSGAYEAIASTGPADRALSAWLVSVESDSLTQECWGVRSRAEAVPTCPLSHPPQPSLVSHTGIFSPKMKNTCIALPTPSGIPLSFPLLGTQSTPLSDLGAFNTSSSRKSSSTAPNGGGPPSPHPSPPKSTSFPITVLGTLPPFL